MAEGIGFYHLFKNNAPYDDNKISPSDYITKEGDDQTVYAHYKDHFFTHVQYPHDENQGYTISDDIPQEFEVFKMNSKFEPGQFQRKNSMLDVPPDAGHFALSTDISEDYIQKRDKLREMDARCAKRSDYQNIIESIALNMQKSIKKLNDQRLLELFEPIFKEASDFSQNLNSKTVLEMDSFIQQLGEKGNKAISERFQEEIQEFSTQKDNLPNTADADQVEEQWSDFQGKSQERIKKIKPYQIYFKKFTIFPQCEAVINEFDGFLQSASNVLKQLKIKKEHSN